MAGTSSRNVKLTWAAAVRDIVTRLIATGQLPIGIFGAAILLMIWKTPSDQIGKVWDVLKLFVNAHAGAGYSSAVVTVVAWFLHARFQRKNAEKELRRLSEDRTASQQRSFKRKLESSEG